MWVRQSVHAINDKMKQIYQKSDSMETPVQTKSSDQHAAIATSSTSSIHSSEPSINNKHGNTFKSKSEIKSQPFTQKRETKTHLLTQKRETDSYPFTQKRETKTYLLTQKRETESYPFTQKSETKSYPFTQKRETKTHLLTQKRETKTHLLTQKRETKTHLLSQKRETETNQFTQRRETKAHLLRQKRETETNQFTQKRETKAHSFTQKIETKTHLLTQKRENESRSENNTKPLALNRNKMMSNSKPNSYNQSACSTQLLLADRVSTGFRLSNNSKQTCKSTITACSSKNEKKSKNKRCIQNQKKEYKSGDSDNLKQLTMQRLKKLYENEANEIIIGLMNNKFKANISEKNVNMDSSEPSINNEHEKTFKSKREIKSQPIFQKREIESHPFTQKIETESYLFTQKRETKSHPFTQKRETESYPFTQKRETKSYPYKSGDSDNLKQLNMQQLKNLEENEANEIIIGLMNYRFKAIIIEKNVNMDLETLAIILKLLSKAFTTSLQQSNQRELMQMLLLNNFFKLHKYKFLSNDFINNHWDAFCALVDIFTEISKKMLDSVVELEEFISIFIKAVALKHLDSKILSKLYALETTIKAKKTSAGFQESEDKHFTQYSILPSLEELQADEPPYLTENLTKEPYQSAEQYLDIQFRLLREDFVAPLREGILGYRLQEKDLQDIWMYEKVKFTDTCYTKSGMEYKLQFQINRWWNVDIMKRFIYGSLLCLSNDNFHTILFAVVTDVQVRDFCHGFIKVKFEDYFGMNTKLTKSEMEAIYTVAQSRAFFEAYRHILKALQTINCDNFPMQKYIIQVEKEMDPPIYLDSSSEYDFMLNDGKIEKCVVLDIDSWPSAEELLLDDSQRTAMHLATTSSLAIIQGPPGTGKTYVGLKIMETLLRNKKVWLDEMESSPILVVSMTNFALDQFLEGVLKFNTNIIRVGSRSESERLKEYSLRSVQRNTIKKSLSYYMMKETEAKLNKMRELIEKNLQIIQNLRTFILHEKGWNFTTSIDQRLIKSLHTGCLSDFNVDPLKTNWGPKSLLAAWLGMTLDPQFVHERDLINFLYDDDQWQYSYNDKDTKEIEEFAVTEENLIDVDDPWDADNKNRQLDVDDYCEIKPVRLQTDQNNKLIWSVEIDLLVDPEYLNNGFQKGDKQNQENIELNPKKIDQLMKAGRLRKKIAQRELLKLDFTKDDELCQISNVWHLSLNDRWRLYRKWINEVKARVSAEIDELQTQYGIVAKKLTEVIAANDLCTFRKCTVIGMTTTAAGRYVEVLNELKPKIVFVEEAARVLESHVITALTSNTEHLILIGDHKQLRPEVNVYKLSRYYNLDISLFERMIRNKVGYATLKIQHRMRPEISRLIVPFIYQELENHPLVLEYEKINGLTKDIFFISHNIFQDKTRDDFCHKNAFEAQYVVNLCYYLLQQTYKPSQITVLTTYNSQLKVLRNLMEKNTFKGIRVTTVDKYQGEENDIILISFVRNNKDGKIGFLKFDNRINVAFSRAKMGLYCIGNFNLFSDKSNFWRQVVKTLTIDNMIGNKLILKCQQHGHVSEITTANDFQARSPEGGCLMKCDKVLPCKHVLICKRLCHPDEHICKEPCPKILCDLNHPCPLRCFEICEPCKVPVEKQHAKCNHWEWHRCHVDIEKVDCTTLVNYLLKCTHSVTLECHIDIANYECQVMVTRELPCKHNGQMLCFKNANSVLCKEKCEYLLKCGHCCPLKCHAEHKIEDIKLKTYYPQKWGHRRDIPKCKVLVEKELPCGHDMYVQCYIDPTIDNVACSNPCSKIFPCGHLCQKKCWEQCKNCNEIVEKILKCKHTIRTECYKSIELLKCNEIVEKILKCKHTIRTECYKSIELLKCNEIVKKILKCKHTIKTECYKSIELLKCIEPCTKKLPCGHICTNFCCEPCETECMHLMSVVGDCEHNINIPCYLKSLSLSVIVKYCENPCREILPCQHTCVGNCGQCRQGRVHVSCKEKKCGRTQICGHQCLFPCSQICPPCDQQCSVRCNHRKCPKLCGQDCTKCYEKCSWSCPHYECTKRCFELCDRERCDQRCPKSLKCGHQCMGICGEKCPSLCRICKNKTMKGVKESAMFIELDCKHCFDVRELDRWMEEDSKYINMKSCPKCKKVIWNCTRYGNLIKNMVADIQKAKQQIFDKEKMLQLDKNEFYESIRKEKSIKKNFPEEINYLGNRLKGKWWLYLSQLVVIRNQIEILKMVCELKDRVAIMIKWDVAQTVFDSDVVDLVQRLVQNKENINEFELTAILKDLIRIRLGTMCLEAVEKESMKRHGQRSDLLNSLDKTIDLFVKKGKPSDQDEREISKHLTKFGIEHGLDQIGDEIFSLKITNEIDLYPGSWIKLANGQVEACLQENREINQFD